jgi:hypothetical protein
MIFKMYDCDFGIKLNGVTYDFEHVQDLQIEDPENTRLTRGSNAANKVGLVYKEGISDPQASDCHYHEHVSSFEGCSRYSLQRQDSP